MRLICDIGNTTSLFSIFHNGEILLKIRLATNSLEYEDQFFVFLNTFLQKKEIEMSDIKGMAVSSVVPSIDTMLKYFSKKYLKKTPVFVNAFDDVGIKYDKTDNLNEIGADRISNVLGASVMHGPDNIVVDFGTAITVDVLKNNSFIGGCILPGLETSMKALFKNTAKLPQIELFFEDHYLGVNTGDNIRIGIVNGTYYALKGIIDECIKVTGPIKVIATGGYSRIFKERKDFFDCIEEDLTLKGTAFFEERVRKI
jgi:type III pantothenate kinase